MEILEYISLLMTLKTFKLCTSDRVRYYLKYVFNINVFFRDRNDRSVYRIQVENERISLLISGSVCLQLSQTQ